MESAYGKVIKEFGWLADFYALDYVVENHWSRLPTFWQQHFDDCIAVAQSESINSDQSAIVELVEAMLDKRKCHFRPRSGPFPLSFIALKRCADLLAIPRQAVRSRREIETLCFGDSKLAENADGLTHLRDVLPGRLRMKIKAKKEHEIERLFDLFDVIFRRLAVDKSTMKTQNWRILDVGSGIGHLSRVLSLLLKVDVTTIEGNVEFVETSLKMDKRFQRSVLNNNINNNANCMGEQMDWKPPDRRVAFIEANAPLRFDEPTDDFVNVLAGLHACGDLSSTIVCNFISDSSARVLVSVGCCYHKLNDGMDKLFRDEYPSTYDNSLHTEEKKGYPLSQRFQDLNLSYASRELASYSMEYFRHKLCGSLHNTVLFVNAYRAVLEWLILDCPPTDSRNRPALDENLRHRGLYGVKNAERLDFWTYARKTLLGDPPLRERILEMRKNQTISTAVERIICNESARILVIYTLRQVVAPLIETVLVEDRRAFLQENARHAGIEQAVVIPLFSLAMSPRNLVLVSYKKNDQ